MKKSHIFVDICKIKSYNNFRLYNLELYKVLGGVNIKVFVFKSDASLIQDHLTVQYWNNVKI